MTTASVPPMAQFAPLINKMTHDYARRCGATRTPFDADDVQQELRIAYWRCSMAFKPDAGVKFMTFLVTAMRNCLNNLFDREQRKSLVGKVISGDNAYDSDAGEGSVWDRVDSGIATPEEEQSAQQMSTWIAERLSPRARALFLMACDPPDVVERQFDALRRGTEAVRAEQFQDGAPMGKSYSTISLPFLSRLFGLTVSEAQSARREIEVVVARYHALGGQ